MTKAKIRTPFFESSVKNYIYGDAVIEYALMLDRAAKEYDIDILFICPYTELRTVREKTDLILLAPYMDTLRPGRGIADVLPEAVKAAGAQGVMLNHCERPMSLPQLQLTIERANELDLLTFACANTLAETRAVAELRPDIINPEPTELIGGTQTSDMGYVRTTLKVIKDRFPDILVEQAAAITTGRQCYDFLMAGNDAVGSASGILRAERPEELLHEMLAHVRKAKEDIAKRGAQ